MHRDPFAARHTDPIPDPFESLSVTARRVLDERGQASRDVELRDLPLMRWCAQVPDARRGPLDFRRFPFQVEMYDERSARDREQVYAKGTQVGISTLMIRWALYHADVHGRIGLYTFPTMTELNDFSRQRIAPTIRASEHLLTRIPSDAVDNVSQKQIGLGWLNFRAANKPIDSIDADFIVFDEYDTSSMSAIEASERRISGPMSAGLLRRVGVPSVPGYGISLAYEKTDQRVWTVKCRACNAQNPMRGAEAFAANVDQDAMRLVCRKCRKPIDVAAGEWVATWPDRDVRGYHVPKLIVPGAQIHTIVENSRKTKPHEIEAFYTRDLAEPYAPAEGRLSLEQVRWCVDDDLRPLQSLRTDKWVTMGIDVASVRALSVVIEEVLDDRTGRRVFVGEIDDGPDGSAFDQLCDLMDAFGVSMACIDHAPEGRFAEAFAQRFPGRVFRVGYFSPQPGARNDSAPWIVDDAARYVSVWRTRAIDAVLERFRTRSVLLPPLDTLPANYPAELGALVRRSEETANGGVRSTYVKTAPDDFAHAEAYNLTAIELLWRRVGFDAINDRSPIPLLPSGQDEVIDLLAGDAPTYRSGF